MRRAARRGVALSSASPSLQLECCGFRRPTRDTNSDISGISWLSLLLLLVSKLLLCKRRKASRHASVCTLASWAASIRSASICARADCTAESVPFLFAVSSPSLLLTLGAPDGDSGAVIEGSGDESSIAFGFEDPSTLSDIETSGADAYMRQRVRSRSRSRLAADSTGDDIDDDDDEEVSTFWGFSCCSTGSPAFPASPSAAVS